MKNMATRRLDDYPLAMLPDRRPVWSEDLDYTLGERARVVAGYVLATLAVLMFVLLVSLAGPR